MKEYAKELVQCSLAAMAGFTKSYSWRTISIDATMSSLGFTSGTSGDFACRQLRRALQDHASRYQGTVRLAMITKKDTTVKAVLIQIIDSSKLRGNNESDAELETAIKDLQEKGL